MSPLGVEPLSAERLAATKVTTMNAESDTVPQHEILPEMSCIACPLHVAMEKIAHSAVQQCVLYLQGECQPRPTLLQELDDWISLHALIRSHICVASRSATISPDDLEKGWAGWFPSHPIPLFRYSVSIFATRWWPACGQPVVLLERSAAHKQLNCQQRHLTGEAQQRCSMCTASYACRPMLICSGQRCSLLGRHDVARTRQTARHLAVDRGQRAEEYPRGDKRRTHE